jgi:crossover junction endodeoxyribonuclease RuvC
MTTSVARDLRRQATQAEKLIWRLLRLRQIGVKFHRQQPIEGYVVDFVSFEHRLIIELDGGQHSEPDEYEHRRTRCLKANGLRLLRFWNNEVMENEEGVFERILEVRAPAPSPSRRLAPGPSLSCEGRGDRRGHSR